MTRIEHKTPALVTIPMLAMLLCCGSAHAAGYAVVEQSAVAGGTGGAGAARTGDPAAAWFNPAAIARTQGLAASAGMLVLFPGLEASAKDDSWTQGLETAPRTPPHVYLSYTFGPAATGIAVNVPFGSSVLWPDNWQGRYQAVSSQLQVIRVAPFIGWSFGPVRIAGGVHVDVASLSVKRRLDFVDTDGDMALELNDIGFGGHAALHVDLGSMVSLGATYKSRSSLSLEGTARFDVPLAFNAKAQDSRVSAGYTLPDLVLVGAEVRPHEQITAVLDLGITVWSVYDALAIDFEYEGTSDVTQTQKWETQVSVRGGVEYRPLRWIDLRLGMFYDPTPVPQATLAPTSPDSDRLGFTAGLGVNMPWGLSGDIFYGYVHMLGQSAQNPENLQANYAGRLQLLGIGLRYRYQ